MNNIIFRTIILGTLLAGLCSCEDKASDAKLRVNLDRTEYQAGDTVTFFFSGKPDNIVFYSGETGHKYENRHAYYADNDLIINFSTHADPYRDDDLEFLVSNDFRGIYTRENVEAARWINITDRFELSQGANGTPSGELSMKQFIENDDDVLYFAFRFNVPGTPLSHRWIIRSFNPVLVSPEGIATSLGTVGTMGWQNVEMIDVPEGQKPTWLIQAANIVTQAYTNRDGWAITKGFDVRQSVPDTGEALKNISTSMDRYQYVYNEPGTYRAVFEASSVWYNGESHSVSEVTVVVK